MAVSSQSSCRFREHHQSWPDRKIVYGGYQVSEVLDEEKVADLMAIARRRIIAVFISEREFVRGVWRSTDNYILGVEGRQSALASYISHEMKKNFIFERDLPLRFAYCNHKLARRLIDNLQAQIILMELNIMCGKNRFHIWYNESWGTWEILPSVVDEYYEQLDRARKLKFDDRSYHGRNRQQSTSRGIPAGTSVSIA